MKNRRWQSVGAFLLALAMAPASQGAAVTFGDLNSTDGNGFPFGGYYQDSYAADRYQQVYSSANFPGAMSIGTVTFYGSSNDGQTADGTYTLSLSTTSAAVNGLDSNMANNVGADNETFFSGSLPAYVKNGTMTFTLSTPFSYNPTNGNLLLDVQISGVTNNSTAFFVSEDGSFTNSSRMINGNTSETSGYGLVTTFGPAAAVPEPGTLGMAAMGGMAVAGLLYRRRRS